MEDTIFLFLDGAIHDRQSGLGSLQHDRASIFGQADSKVVDFLKIDFHGAHNVRHGVGRWYLFMLEGIGFQSRARAI